jgi:hypothetical protein
MATAYNTNTGNTVAVVWRGWPEPITTWILG